MTLLLMPMMCVRVGGNCEKLRMVKESGSTLLSTFWPPVVRSTLFSLPEIMIVEGCAASVIAGSEISASRAGMKTTGHCMPLA